LAVSVTVSEIWPVFR